MRRPTARPTGFTCTRRAPTRSPATGSATRTRRTTSRCRSWPHGADTTLAIDWGSYPDDNTTYTFTRSFTFRTAAAFPAGPGTVMVSVAAQAAAGENQPLTSVLIANVGATGGNASVTLGTNQKRQINVKLRAKRQWTPGERFHPSIVVTLTYTGGPANYYVFTVPTVVTVE